MKLNKNPAILQILACYCYFNLSSTLHKVEKRSSFQRFELQNINTVTKATINVCNTSATLLQGRFFQKPLASKNPVESGKLFNCNLSPSMFLAVIRVMSIAQPMIYNSGQKVDFRVGQPLVSEEKHLSPRNVTWFVCQLVSAYSVKPWLLHTMNEITYPQIQQLTWLIPMFPCKQLNKILLAC